MIRVVVLLSALLFAACSGPAELIEHEATIPLIEIQLVITATFTPVPPTATSSPTATLQPTATFAPPPTLTPSIRTENTGQIIAGLDTAFLYSLPDDGSEISRILYEYTPVEILGRAEDGAWLEVAITDGSIGWMRAENVKTEWDIDSLTVVGARATATPAEEIEFVEAEGIVRFAGLRLRELPSTEGRIIRFLREDSRVRILARATDSAWLKVVTGQDQTGWVSAQYITTDVDLSRIAITTEEFNAR